MDPSRLNPLHIIGCGPGGSGFVSPQARKTAASADWVGGSEANLKLLRVRLKQRIPLASGEVESWLDHLQRLWRGGNQLAVLVSGDPGLCSLSARVVQRFGRDACRIVPGVSSIQAAFAAVGEEWLGCRIISAHAGIPAVDPTSLLSEPKLAILSGHPAAASWIEHIGHTLRATHQCIACENLTLPQERLHHWESQRFTDLAPKTVLLFLKKPTL